MNKIAVLLLSFLATLTVFVIVGTVVVALNFDQFKQTVAGEPSASEDQQELDRLWQAYPVVNNDAPISDEMQFRRVQIRRQVRAILSRHPDWPPDGTAPGHGRDLRRDEMSGTLRQHADFDASYRR